MAGVPTRALMRALSELLGARGSRRWMQADELRRMRGATPMSNILLGAKTRGPGALSSPLAEAMRYTPEQSAADGRWLQAGREAGITWRPGIDNESDLKAQISRLPAWRKTLLLTELGHDFGAERGSLDTRLWHAIWRRYWRAAKPPDLTAAKNSPAMLLRRQRALSHPADPTIEQLIETPELLGVDKFGEPRPGGRLGSWGAGLSNTPLLGLAGALGVREALLSEMDRS